MELADPIQAAEAIVLLEGIVLPEAEMAVQAKESNANISKAILSSVAVAAAGVISMLAYQAFGRM